MCIHRKHGHYIEGKIDMEINKGEFIFIFLKKKWIGMVMDQGVHVGTSFHWWEECFN